MVSEFHHLLFFVIFWGNDTAFLLWPNFIVKTRNRCSKTGRVLFREDVIRLMGTQCKLSGTRLSSWFWSSVKGVRVKVKVMAADLWKMGTFKTNLLNNPWFKEKVSRKIGTYFEPMKENGSRAQQSVWDPERAALGMKWLLWNSTKPLKEKHSTVSSRKQKRREHVLTYFMRRAFPRYQNHTKTTEENSR